MHIFLPITYTTSYGGDFMDPLSSPIPTQPIITSQTYGNNLFMASMFASSEEENDFLASLDSDTRDYVLKHTDEFRTKQDIIDCIDRLHGRKRS